MLLEDLEQWRKYPMMSPIVKTLLECYIDSEQSFRSLSLLFSPLPKVAGSMYSFFQKAFNSNSVSISWVDSSDQSVLAQIVRRNQCRSSLTKLIDDQRDEFICARHRRDFLNAWELFIQGFNLLDPNATYWNAISSVFNSAWLVKEFPELVLDLAKEAKAPQDLCLFAALSLMEKGDKANALKIFPDEAILNKTFAILGGGVF
jgi:hypothetical protein